MLKLQIPIALALLALSGCAPIQGIQARDSAEILAEAGFARQGPGVVQSASGGSASTLQVRQLTRVALNGETAYEFYDPQFCQCVYVGGEKEFAKLQELRKQRRADHAWYLQHSSPISNAADPQTWSAWAPEGLDVK